MDALTWHHFVTVSECLCEGAGWILESTVTPKGLILQAVSISLSLLSHKHSSQGRGEIWRKTDEFSLLLHLIVPSACTGHQIPFLMTCLGLPPGKRVFSSSNLSVCLDIGRESQEKEKKKKMGAVFCKMCICTPVQPPYWTLILLLFSCFVLKHFIYDVFTASPMWRSGPWCFCFSRHIHTNGSEQTQMNLP